MSIFRINIPLRRTVALTDIFVLAALLAVLYGLLMVGRQWTDVLRPHVVIDLSPWSLPKYTFFSLIRGLLAYGFSLVFTLVYGYIAAYNKRAERVMLPVLDILQSLPVLAFLPGLVLAFIALFPGTNIGLEIACVIMIFTGQAWNMTFSFYSSLRGIPQEMREVAGIHKFSWWRRFTQLELPYSMIGLVWNSMMSMAGGWFFLMVTEAFTLENHDFRLPGVGSYMAVAAKAGNNSAMVAGMIAMVAMIVLVDQVIWKPIVVWSDKFKFEETSSGASRQSFILNLLRSSRIAERVGALGMRFLGFVDRFFERAARPLDAAHDTQRRIGSYLLLALLAVASIAGALKLVGLISAVPGGAWGDIGMRAGTTFLRVIAALVLATLWTIPVGVAIGRSQRLSRILQPVVQTAASFPAPMLFPVVVVVLFRVGIGFDIGAMFLMMLGTQWYILFNTIAGASAIPADLIEATLMYRLGTIRRWRHLILPSLFPYLITGWLTAAGGAWNASIVAEYENYGAKTYVAYGLGSAISQATNDGNFALLAASAATMVLIVVGTNRFLWKPLYSIAQSRYSLNK
jgi:NitT/TauT family transport system permease protein